MPARNVVRCRPRSSVDLDPIEERNCVDWVPLLPHTQFKTFAAMRAVWTRHGREILRHYIRQRPGTRPFAVWALGELPLPAIKNEPTRYSPSTEIEGHRFYDRWHYFGSRTGEDEWYCAGSSWGEFDLLRRLGVVDAAEAELAEEWIDDREYAPGRDHRHYASLSQLEATAIVLTSGQMDAGT